jgi:hypothetical protein
MGIDVLTDYPVRQPLRFTCSRLTYVFGAKGESDFFHTPADLGKRVADADNCLHEYDYGNDKNAINSDGSESEHRVLHPTHLADAHARVLLQQLRTVPTIDMATRETLKGGGIKNASH